MKENHQQNRLQRNKERKRRQYQQRRTQDLFYSPSSKQVNRLQSTEQYLHTHNLSEKFDINENYEIDELNTVYYCQYCHEDKEARKYLLKQ